MVAQTLQSAVDIRKFVVDATSVPDATVSSANAQGNFQTLESAIQWVSYNNQFTNVIDVRGQFVLASDPGLNAANPIVLSGDAASATLTFNTVLTLNDVTFQNLTLNFNKEVSFGNNVFFDNCVVTFGVSGVPSGSSILDIGFDSSAISFTSTFSLPLGTQINNSSIGFTGSSPSPITLYGSNLINNCNFDGYISRFIVLNGSNIDITFCSFTSYNNPVGDGTYVATNLANTGNAVIYNNGSVSNVNILNCNFSSILLDRYPYISFEFNASTTNVADVVIRGNNFTQTNTTGDDIRAAVVFSSNVASVPATFPFLPKLVNVLIDSNTCNYDQSILITGARNAGLVNGALLATDNVIVSKNVCGTIGFITAFDTPANFANNTNSAIQDKFGSLIINANSCKFISNIDNLGKFIPFIGSNFPTYNITPYVFTSTGPATISDNSCNWIQVGSLFGLLPGTGPGQGYTITNNRLYSINPSFLGNFTDTNSGITPGNVALLIGGGANGLINTTYNSVIGNTVVGANTSNNGGTATFNAYNCAMACFDNATITNNSFDTAISANTSVFLYIGANANVMVRSNSFVRQGLTIQAYISGPGGFTNGAVEITYNYFDSSYYDAADTIENTNNGFISSNWVFERNVNQIGYTSLNARALIPNGLTAGITTSSSQLSGAMLNVSVPSGISDGVFLGLSTLNTLLPSQTQLLQVALGTTVTSGVVNIDTAATNNFGFFLGQQYYAGFSLASPPVGLLSTLANNFSNGGPSGNWTSNNIPNPYNSSTNFVTVNAGNIAAWGGSPPFALFAYLDVTSYDLFANRGNSLDFFVVITATTTGPVTIQLSPILFKYKW